MKMKNLSLEMLLLIVVLSFTMCKKESTSTLPGNAGSPSESESDFNARIMNLTPKQVAEKVNIFKEQVAAKKAISANKATDLPSITVSYFTPDSALWLIESSLNFTYDEGTSKDTVSTSLDTTYYSNAIPISGGNIKASDVIDVYNEISDHCNTITSAGNRVMIVDVIKNNNSDGVTFYAKMVILNSPSLNLSHYACVPIGQSAAWSRFFASPCSSNTNDAPSMCTRRLNCQLPWPSCGAGVIFMSPVTTLQCYNSNNAYPGALYHKYPNYNCDPTVLTASQMNSFVSGCQAIGTSNIPAWNGPYPAISIANYNINPNAPGGNAFVSFWYMDITYGRAFCAQ